MKYQNISSFVTTGERNVAIGSNALCNNTVGQYNSAIGYTVPKLPKIEKFCTYLNSEGKKVLIGMCPEGNHAPICRYGNRMENIMYVPIGVFLSEATANDLLELDSIEEYYHTYNQSVTNNVNIPIGYNNLKNP